ncbi:MAG: M28 family peptidase [Candidatus Bathyarchaeia archaeon]
MKKQFFVLLLGFSVLASPLLPFRMSIVYGSTSTGLSSLEEQIVGLANGTRAYGYDLQLENIALAHPDFRSAGSIGALEAANWIKAQFESFSLDAWLEPFTFKNWTLSEKPSLIIDEDGNQSTTSDQTVIDSFQCEHYSWPTPDDGVFTDLVVLPLDDDWSSIDTTGKIVLIGREVQENKLVAKVRYQTPAAVVFTWWEDRKNFTPPLHYSAGGRPLSSYGSYFWDYHVPAGFVNYWDGLLIREKEGTNAALSANVTIRAVIGDGTHYNVVGKIGGYANPEDIVIISSHYDTVMCAGFCDNGAGTAGIIEIAKVITDAINSGLYQPNRTLLFVAFTAEELYLVGSANYVAQHKSEMANITAVINLDCIGSDYLYVTNTPYSDLAQRIINASQDLGISINVEEPGGSDQESFRTPNSIKNAISSYWGVNLGISDATPVPSSVMLCSYPLFYSDLWTMGEAGWIHTAYDNSTTPNWVELKDLEDHIKVALLVTIRESPNLIPELTPLAIITTLVTSTVIVYFLTKKRILRRQKLI